MCDLPCQLCLKDAQQYSQKWLESNYPLPTRCFCCTTKIEVKWFAQGYICSLCTSAYCPYCINLVDTKPGHAYHCVRCTNGSCNHAGGISKRNTTIDSFPNKNCDPKVYPAPYRYLCNMHRCVRWLIEKRENTCPQPEICTYMHSSLLPVHKCYAAAKKMNSTTCVLPDSHSCYFEFMDQGKLSEKQHKNGDCWIQPCSLNCKMDCVRALHEHLELKG